MNSQAAYLAVLAMEGIPQRKAKYDQLVDGVGVDAVNTTRHSCTPVNPTRCPVPTTSRCLYLAVSTSLSLPRCLYLAVSTSLSLPRCLYLAVSTSPSLHYMLSTVARDQQACEVLG